MRGANQQQGGKGWRTKKNDAKKTRPPYLTARTKETQKGLNTPTWCEEKKSWQPNSHSWVGLGTHISSLRLSLRSFSLSCLESIEHETRTGLLFCFPFLLKDVARFVVGPGKPTNLIEAGETAVHMATWNSSLQGSIKACEHCSFFNRHVQVMMVLVQQ